MNNDELNKSLWELISTIRGMNFHQTPEQQTAWDALLAVPGPDFWPEHSIFCAIEQDHLGVRVVMTDATNNVVERLKISPPYTRED